MWDGQEQYHCAQITTSSFLCCHLQSYARPKYSLYPLGLHLRHQIFSKWKEVLCCRLESKTLPWLKARQLEATVCLFSSCFSCSHNSRSIILASFGEELAACWHKAALIRTMECLIKYPQAMAVCQHPVPVQAKKPPTFNNSSMQPNFITLQLLVPHSHCKEVYIAVSPLVPFTHSFTLQPYFDARYQTPSGDPGTLAAFLECSQVTSLLPCDPFALLCRDESCTLNQIFFDSVCGRNVRRQPIFFVVTMSTSVQAEQEVSFGNNHQHNQLLTDRHNDNNFYAHRIIHS